MKVSKFLALLGVAGAMAFVAGPARADGDAAAGEKVFARCKSCHTAEKGGPHRVGPNLFGVVGRAFGGTDFARYSAGMKAAKAKGLMVDEAALAKYIPDGAKYLEEVAGQKGQGMTPQKLDDKQMADVIAYLKSLK